MIVELNTIRQENYETSSEYLDIVDEKLNKLNVIKNLSAQERNKEREKIINYGMHKVMHMLLFNKELVEINAIIEYLNQLKDVIIKNKPSSHDRRSEMLYELPEK